MFIFASRQELKASMVCNVASNLRNPVGDPYYCRIIERNAVTHELGDDIGERRDHRVVKRQCRFYEECATFGSQESRYLCEKRPEVGDVMQNCTANGSIK